MVGYDMAANYSICVPLLMIMARAGDNMAAN